MSKVLCPECPHFYDSGDFKLTDPDGKVLDQKLVTFWDRTFDLHPRWVQASIHNRRIAATREKNERGAQWLCPAGHSVPDEFADNKTVVIGLLGAPATMKTTYLGQLVRALTEQDALSGLGVSARIADGRSRKAYSKLAARLEANLAPTATQLLEGDAVTEPLVVRMTVGTPYKKQTYHLLFFDVAGESTQQLQVLAQDNTFLHVMDAAMFFVTPASLELGVPHAWGFEQPGTRAAVAVFDLVGDALRHHPKFAGSSAMKDLPAALIFAKCDLLAPFLPAGREFESLPADESFLAQTDEKLDNVGSLPYEVLVEKGGRAVVTKLFEFSDRRSIHAVSALGANPTAVDVPLPTLKPFNVVDPLLAVLYGLAIIGDPNANDV